MVDISIKDLVKAYDDGVNILNGLSFDIQSGEHVGILGRNGCGKTTMFRILSGEESSAIRSASAARRSPMA